MLKKLVVFSTLYLVFSVVAANAQKNESEETPQVQPAQTVERESSPPPSPPREEPRTETPKQSEPTPPPPSNTSPPSTNDSPRSQNRRERDSDSENSNSNRRRDRDENKPPRRKPLPPGDIQNPPPSDNPPAPPPPDQNPAPPPNAEGNNNQGRNRNWNKDRDEEKNRRRRRSNGSGGWDNYSTTPIYVPSANTPTRPFSANDYFGSNDVFFNIYDVLLEKSFSYESFFEDSPSEAFQPLYYTYGREFFTNEFHFVSTDWTVYYEPDLDDIFVNFAKLGQTKFERMALYPVGDTIKKANKKFGYKGQFVRPVLVEKIPGIGADKLYSFSVHDLPKGEYELRLIARDGSTAKHFIRLK